MIKGFFLVFNTRKVEEEGKASFLLLLLLLLLRSSIGVVGMCKGGGGDSGF